MDIAGQLKEREIPRKYLLGSDHLVSINQLQILTKRIHVCENGQLSRTGSFLPLPFLLQRYSSHLAHPVSRPPGTRCPLHLKLLSPVRNLVGSLMRILASRILCGGSNRQIHTDYWVLWRKRDSTTPLSGGECPDPCLDSFYCFSGHITLRMILIYYSHVAVTENKGQGVANYIKEEGYLQM